MLLEVVVVVVFNSNMVRLKVSYEDCMEWDLAVSIPIWYD